MDAELQQIVDALAGRLERGVLLEDKRWRVKAYCTRYGPVDDGRLQAILRRETPREGVEFMLAQGIADAEEPIRIPANPKLGLEPRVGLAVRCQGLLLGFMWLIDPERSLTGAELNAASDAACAAGACLYREHLLREGDRLRERELVRRLIGEDAQGRAHAAAELLEGGFLSTRTPVAAFVARPTVMEERLAEEDALAVEYALERLRSETAPRSTLHLVRGDHALLIAAVDASGAAAGDTRQMGRSLRHAVAHALGLGCERVVVGVGATREHLLDARRSYDEAIRAAQVAGSIASAGPVAHWSAIGVYRLLSRYVDEPEEDEIVPDELQRIFSSRDGAELIRTLETYLDLACDVKATSDALALHRTSLYYRLQKIERLAGVDLHRGEDRLLLHLGLRLARLSGRHPLGSAPALEC
jgi:sugar diacid utilization regulator